MKKIRHAQLTQNKPHSTALAFGAGVLAGLCANFLPSIAFAEPPEALATSAAIPEPFEGSAFPNRDWALHGGPAIGTQTNDKSQLLDETIKDSSFGSTLKSAGIHLTGWTTFGYNVSNAQGSNLPMGYTIFPNELDLTEAVFRIVKNVDTVQKDHVDWGFKVDALFGVDYYMFLSKGIFSDQLLVYGNKYGYDLPQVYADVYFPTVVDGLNIRAGRILTNPTVYMGRNQLFTHTVFDNNIADTQTGVVGTLKVGREWTFQAGPVNTGDVALWDHTDSKLSVFAAIEWTSPAQMDSIYLMAYGLNDGNYVYHNWQTFYGIWTHKFSNDLFSRFQSAYYYENNVPVSNTSGLGYIPVGTLSNSNATVGRINGYSLVELLDYSFTPKDYVALRAEYSADPQGSLTGTAANYLGFTLGFGHNFTQWLTATAELRRDHSYMNLAYDNGNLSDLSLFATSMSFRF